MGSELSSPLGSHWKETCASSAPVLLIYVGLEEGALGPGRHRRRRDEALVGISQRVAFTEDVQSGSTCEEHVSVRDRNAIGAVRRFGDTHLDRRRWRPHVEHTQACHLWIPAARRDVGVAVRHLDILGEGWRVKPPHHHWHRRRAHVDNASAVIESCDVREAARDRNPPELGRCFDPGDLGRLGGGGDVDHPKTGVVVGDVRISACNHNVLRFLRQSDRAHHQGRRRIRGVGDHQKKSATEVGVAFGGRDRPGGSVRPESDQLGQSCAATGSAASERTTANDTIRKAERGLPPERIVVLPLQS